MKTGNPVTDTRLSLKMNQTDFAAALGVAQATVSRWETEKHAITQVVLMAMERLVEQQRKVSQ